MSSAAELFRKLVLNGDKVFSSFIPFSVSHCVTKISITKGIYFIKLYLPSSPINTVNPAHSVRIASSSLNKRLMQENYMIAFFCANYSAAKAVFTYIHFYLYTIMKT